MNKEISQTDKDMQKLSDLGWKTRFDTFETYWKEINDYEIVVSKHINSKSWDCTLVQHFDEYTDKMESAEVTINLNATFDWVIKLVDILSTGT